MNCFYWLGKIIKSVHNQQYRHQNYMLQLLVFLFYTNFEQILRNIKLSLLPTLMTIESWESFITLCELTFAQSQQ